jgi:Zn-dependent protease with chaperone function
MFALAAHAGVRLRAVSILTSATPRPPVALATRWRDVILNEALLQSLSRREVDAVVCHELSHVHSVKRSAMLGLYVLIVATVLGTQWVPHFIDVVPALLLAV